MKYDFDKVVERRKTNSVKWDMLQERFGANDLIPMWVADMDFEVPPKVSEAIKERANHNIYGYGVKPQSYYDAIIEWIKKRHGWETKKEWLLYTPGVVPALNWAVMTYTAPGDQVLIQPPVYYPFFNAVKNNDRILVKNELVRVGDHYEMNFEDLEEKLSDEKTKMMILCSPHNPVGRVWTKEELTKLGELCLKHNVIIVCDEIHSDLVYKQYKHTPIALISKELENNTITCYAPSKTFNIAGLGASTIVIPNEELRNKFTDTMKRISVNIANPFAVVATEAAYKYGEDWLEDLLAYLYDNYKYVCEFLSNRIPQIKPLKLEGTYLMWLDCKDLNMNDKELKEFIIKDAKLALNDGLMFGEAGSGYQRLNIACPRSTLKKALINLEKAIRNLK